MNLAHWRERLAEHSAGSGFAIDDVQTRLARLHGLMATAPDVAAQAFRDLDEAELDRTSRLRAEALGLEGASLDWLGAAGALAPMVKAAATELRALDRALALDNGRPGGGSPSDWILPDRSAYVAPVNPHRGRSEAVRTGQSLGRRGLLFHRVIPTEIGGADVVLYGGIDTGRDLATGSPLAALMFDGLTLVPDADDGSKTFVIEAVQCPGHAEQLDAQLDALVGRDGVLAAVWPELTLPPPLQQQLLDRLRTWPLDAEDSRPELVIAGSWHEPEDGGVVNRTHVHDGYGGHRLAYDKVMPFPLKHRWERIRQGTCLPVLVYGDLLIGFAICRDFCDRSRRPPYNDLPLDLVIVPSYGDAKTMDYHRSTAADIRILHGASTFVVQQTEPDDTPLRGYVLPPSVDPAVTLTADLAISDPVTLASFQR